jgi:hypothetical protein
MIFIYLFIINYDVLTPSFWQAATLDEMRRRSTILCHINPKTIPVINYKKRGLENPVYLAFPFAGILVYASIV